MPLIVAPQLPPLALPRTPAPPLQGASAAQPAAPTTTAPRANGAAAAAQPALLPADQPADPADCAALLAALDRFGGFTPAPLDPPWQDPRSDLADDHSRWWLVLEAAWRLDGQDPEGLFGALVGLRGCGARLELANAETWGARPDDPPPTYRLVRGAELSEAEYAELRQRYLVPHRAALTRLLSAPAAASIAHQPPAPAAQPAPRAAFTGRAPAPATAAQPAPRKNDAGR